MSHLHIPTDDTTEQYDTVQQLPFISPNRTAARASWRGNNTQNNNLISPVHNTLPTTTLKASPSASQPTPHNRTTSYHDAQQNSGGSYSNYTNQTQTQRQSRRRTAPVNGFAQMLASQLKDQQAANGSIETPTGQPFAHKTFHNTETVQNNEIKLNAINAKQQTQQRRASVVSPTAVATSPIKSVSNSTVNSVKSISQYNIQTLTNLALIQQISTNSTATQLIRSVLTNGMILNVCDNTTQQKTYRLVRCWMDTELQSMYYTALEPSTESLLSKLSLSPNNSKNIHAVNCDTLQIRDIVSVTVSQPYIVILTDSLNNTVKVQFDNKVQYNEFILYIEYCIHGAVVPSMQRQDSTGNKQQAVPSTTTCIKNLVVNCINKQNEQQQAVQQPPPPTDVSRARLPLNKDLSDKIQQLERDLERCYQDHSNLQNQERKHTQPLIDELHNVTVENTWLKAQLKQATPRSAARGSGTFVPSTFTKFSPKSATPISTTQQVYVA